MGIALATGVASIAMGATFSIAGLPFVQTPAGLIQETPLTCGQLATLAETQMPGGYTLAQNRFGMLAMDGLGGVHVLTRGPKNNPKKWTTDFVVSADRAIQTLDSDPNYQTYLARGISVGLMPASRIYVDPRQANFPVDRLSWYYGAAIAVALMQLQPHYFVRMIKDREYDRIVLSDGQEQEADVIARARGVKDLVPVVGEAAEARKSRWGLVDVFGNVSVWTVNPSSFSSVLRNKSPHRVSRVLRGVSWFGSPQGVQVTDRHSLFPRNQLGGVRFVAVPRTLRSDSL